MPDIFKEKDKIIQITGTKGAIYGLSKNGNLYELYSEEIKDYWEFTTDSPDSK